MFSLLDDMFAAMLEPDKQTSGRLLTECEQLGDFGHEFEILRRLNGIRNHSRDYQTPSIPLFCVQGLILDKPLHVVLGAAATFVAAFRLSTAGHIQAARCVL